VDPRGPLAATYLDTSVIARLVLREGDLDIAEQAMRTHPMSSLLARLETTAAISRRHHEGMITPEERDTLLAGAQADVLSALTLLPVDDEVFALARTTVIEHPVRTLDSLHLATALVAERHTRRHGGILRFCTADLRQERVARALFRHDRVLLVPPLNA
jgi:predicted nucleic acid-binding protein